MYSREEPEHTKYDGVLSNRELLNRLHAVAVGIRDFEEELNPTPLGEVKEKRVRVKNNNTAKSNKAGEEPSEKKLSTPTLKKASTNSSSKAILKAASKVRKGIVVKESREAREKLAFSDTYLEKAFGLSTSTAPVSEKPTNAASISASKRFGNVTDDRSTRKTLKATTKQSALLATGDESKPAIAKKEARPREFGGDGSDEKFQPTKKKAKVSAVKSVTNQRIRVLPHEMRVLPQAALAEVMAAKVPIFPIFTHWNFLLYHIVLSYVGRGCCIIFSTDLVVRSKIQTHLASYVLFFPCL